MSPEPKKQYDRYINRDLSWLKFNARVLQEANDASVPLIERLRFLGIFSNNLDEFFKVRYAAIKRIVDAGKVGRSELGGMSAIELQESITQTVIAQQQQSLDILGAIEHELAKEGVHVINETQITPAQSEFIIDYFLREVSYYFMSPIFSPKEQSASIASSCQ